MRVLTLVLSLVFMNNVFAGGSVAEGEKAYAAKGCIGCHGPAGKSPNPAVFPTTAGKSAEYIKTSLQEFRSQKRNNPMMTPMAAGLSDADIDNLAAYLSAQK